MSADEARASARSAQAYEVVVLGAEAPIPADPAVGFSEGSSWDAFSGMSSTVRNYGRLPVSDVTLIVNFPKKEGDLAHVVPVGPLAPCFEVALTPRSSLYTSGELQGVEPGVPEFEVHFTDGAGVRWTRGSSGPPHEDPLPRTFKLPSEHIVRTDITAFSPCG